MQKSSNPSQNSYVLNYIKTKRPLSKSIHRKIARGGFSTIYLAQIQFWYVSSYNLNPTALVGIETYDPHRKMIAVKREDTKI